MSKQWYGSIDNRMEENRMLCEAIEVGTKMTQYLWSDRTAWEVIEVINQKYVIVRELSAKCIGGPYSNQWELSSDEKNRTMELKKGRKYWYKIERTLKGEEYKEKVNVTFGVADYYYDYEF